MSDPERDVRSDESVRDEAVAWLNRLRGADDRQDHAAFERWYAADPRHADIYDDVLDSWELTGLADRTPAGEARKRMAVRPGSGVRWPVFAALAAVIILVLAGIGIRQAHIFRSQPQTTELATRSGEIRRVTLADGSRVTLDGNTALHVALLPDERRLTLKRGRARFDVAHDRNRPFVVSAGDGLVIAHGTIFDVELRGHGMAVSLLRGSVEVRQATSRGDERAAKPVYLTPGHRALIRDGDHPPAVETFQPDETGWDSTMLSFEDAPLSQVIAAANGRNGQPPIVLADPATRTLRFTGTFQANDLDGLAQMLAATFDLNVERGRSGIVLAGPGRPKNKLPG